MPQVLDFFRTVNEDAHQLRRMGSDGVYGCGGLVLRLFASCLRRAGLGNPGASVENLAFGTAYPLDVQPNQAAGRPRSGGRPISGDFVLTEEDLEDDEDYLDEEDLSAQVHVRSRQLT